MAERSLVVGLNAVIVAVTEEVPRILVVQRPDHEPPEALPFGPLDPTGDRTLDRALRRWVLDQTGLELGYVEQLYTFGDRDRDPREGQGGARVLSVAYLALVREGLPSGGREARWRDAYRYLPWEDWRDGRPSVLERRIAPALERWVEEGSTAVERTSRRERADISFGLSGVAWDGERVLERYELLYEAGRVLEAERDRACRAVAGGSDGTEVPPTFLGQGMALDHRRILATALGRLRGKLKYRPVVFELLAPTFTLLQLQRVVEALAGVRLHKQNFRRLVEKGGLVEGTGRLHPTTGGRPAELFSFRREVLRERPAPGVGLPGARRT
jgi:hypothetical protein